MPHASPFVVAVFFSSLSYFGSIAAITALVMFLRQPSAPAMHAFIGGMVFAASTWLIAFFKRRRAFCPLCKGTPLMDTGAHTHTKAFRLPPFNHGTTATLSLIFTHRFRCMYCGSRYDLLKKPSHSLPAETAE